MKRFFNDLVEGRRPKPVVLDQSRMVPEARGRVWDLRSGRPRVMDFSAGPRSDIDRDAFARTFEQYPDQELVGFIVDGVQFKAHSLERGLVTVLCPHLTSLRDAPGSVEKELVRLKKLGYHAHFASMPLAPIRVVPQGCVARKLEPDRYRRVADGGAMRQDPDYGEALSLNKSIDLHGVVTDSSEHASHTLHSPEEDELGIDHELFAPAELLDLELIVEADGTQSRSIGNRKWPKELKPTAQERLHDDAILLAASQCGFGPLVGFTDDFADFFNQLATHPSQWWMSCFVWRPLPGSGEAPPSLPGPLTFWVEFRLGFGYSCSSGIAQRFAEALLWQFRREFDAEEDLAFDDMLRSLPASDPRVVWIQRRRKLSARTGRNECRLYSAKVFTDDLSFSVVGIARCLRAMRLWKSIVTRFNLRMAIAKKRQNGTANRWIGADFFSTPGILSVPPEKRVLMLPVLEKLAAGTDVTWGEFQELAGRLEHVLGLLSEARRRMYFFYGTISRRGRILGRNSIVSTSTELRQQADAWRVAVLTTAGCRAADCLDVRPHAAPHAPGRFVWSSDAAKDGAKIPGAGGYMHGYYFSFAWRPQDLSLHITALEFIAAVFAVIVFHPLLRGAQVLGQVDASVVERVVTADRASSPVLQFIHMELLKLPEYSMPANFNLAHIYGEANIMADATSRGELEALRDGAALLGVRLRCLELPEKAVVFLDRVHDFVARQPRDGNVPPPLRADPCRGRRIGEASNPGPLWIFKTKNPVPSHARNSTATAPPTPRGIGLGRFGARSAGAPTLFRAERPEPENLRTTWPLLSNAPRPTSARFLFPQVTKRSTTCTSLRSNARLSSLRAAKAGPLLSTSKEFARPRPLRTAKPKFPLLATSDGRGTQPPLKETQSAGVKRRAHFACETSRKSARPTTRWTLSPKNPEAIELLETELEAAAKDAPRGTLAKEKVAWRRWESYCATQWDTHPVRNNRDAHEGRDWDARLDEEKLQAGFLIHLLGVLKPRRKSDAHVKPQTLMDNLLSVRRVHERVYDVKMCKPSCLSKLFRRILTRFVEANGPEALIPERKQPASAALLASLLAIPDGAQLRSSRLQWASPLGISLKAMLCTAFSGGFRKAELALPSGSSWSNMHISRASLSWRIGGKLYADPDPSVLSSVALGDFAILIPPPSKADPFGAFFGGRPVYFPFGSESVNAAAALLALELDLECRGPARRETPLFVLDRHCSPFTASRADSLLQAMLALVLSPDECSKYSWHSFRIGLACALLAAGASHDLIQAMCRWKSAESLVVYARLNPETYGAWIVKAQMAPVSSVASRNLPQIDDSVHASILANLANWSGVNEAN